MSDNQQVRDELAEAMGWEQHGGFHPIFNTLDAAAACLPEGWTWRRWLHEGRWSWIATSKNEQWMILNGIVVPDTGDEKADRFALALAVIAAKESGW